MAGGKFWSCFAGNDMTPSSKTPGQDEMQVLKNQLQRLKLQMVSSSAAQEDELSRVQQVRPSCLGESSMLFALYFVLSGSIPSHKKVRMQIDSSKR